MSYLSIQDCVNLIRTCQAWSGPAAEAFYTSPPFNDRLYGVLIRANTTHPYALLIREIIITGVYADELLMGDLKDLLEICTNLVSLRLENYFNFSNTFPAIIHEHIPFISRLELPGCHINDSFMVKLVSSVKSLRHLDVSYTQVSLDVFPIILKECKLLETLDMTGCSVKSDKVLSKYESNEFFISDNQLKRYQSSLSQLSFSKTGANDQFVLFTVRHCPNLEILMLSACEMISDSSLTVIGSQCSRLQELDLSFCSHITDAGLQSLAIQLSNIPNQEAKQVNKRDSPILLRPPSIGYNAFHEYQERPKRLEPLLKLQKVDLSGLPLISKSSVCLLAEKCPRLTQIILNDCPTVLEWYFGTTAALENEYALIALSRNDILKRKFMNVDK